MYIEKLFLKNWCRFRDSAFEFGEMTAIRGENGVGKTSLVQAIPFALTGDPGLPGAIEENVNQLAPAGESSSVRLQFRHAGSSFDLTRDLPRGSRAAKAVLLMSGGEAVRGAVKIKQRLLPMLGVDDKLLSEYVFVPQWSMFAFIEQKPEDRAKTFAKLFGTEKAEKIWEALGKVKLVPVPCSIDREVVTARVDEANRHIEAWKTKLTELEAEQLALVVSAADRKRLIAAFVAAQACRDRLPGLQTKFEESERSRQVAQSSAAQSLLAVAAIQESIEPLKAGEAKAVEAASAWKAFRTATDLLKGAQDRRQQAAGKLQQAEAAKPAEVAGYITPADRQATKYRWAAAVGNRQVLTDFIAKCDPDKGVAACPTCGTITAQPDLAKRIADAKATIPQLSAQIEELGTLTAASDAYDLGFARWQSGVSSMSTSLKQAELAEAAIVVPYQPLQTEGEAVALVSSLRHAEARLASAQETRQAADRQAAATAATAASAYQALEHGKAELSALPLVSRDDAERLDHENTRMAGAQVEMQAMAEAITRGLATVQDCEGLLKRAEEELKQFWRVQRADQHVQALRDLYHRDRLPARVSQHFLNAVRHDVDTLLDRFEAPFRLAGVDELQLVVRFYDGRVGLAERMLSGGEKMLLALAFRVTVGLLFAGDLGILCLDEPTVGLDAKNIGCVEIALQRLRELGRSRGLQFILITHERALANVCDKVIDLSQLREEVAA